MGKAKNARHHSERSAAIPYKQLCSEGGPLISRGLPRHPIVIGFLAMTCFNN